MVQEKQEAELRYRLERAVELTAEQTAMRQGMMTAAKADQLRTQLAVSVAVQ